jgi:hypothetical protein
MPQTASCKVCGAPLTSARGDHLVERPTGYTLVRHVAPTVCPGCGKTQAIPGEQARLDAVLSGRRMLWSTWISPDTATDFRPRAGEAFLILRPPEPPRFTWTVGRVSALGVIFAYLVLSLLSANDARMLRVAGYASAALALIWFSDEFGARLNMPKWTGAAMGWFLLVFPVVVLSLYAVVY